MRTLVLAALCLAAMPATQAVHYPPSTPKFGAILLGTFCIILAGLWCLTSGRRRHVVVGIVLLVFAVLFAGAMLAP